MDNYIEIPFPIENDIVYQIGIYYKKTFVPFYVGQSSRHIGRLGDYISAKFSASTDFKIGEAVKYLREKKHDVRVLYKISKNKMIDEKKLIQDIQQKYQLLNGVKGYDYKTANEIEEKVKIHSYIDQFLSDVKTIYG